MDASIKIRILEFIIPEVVTKATLKGATKI